ncbi:MAG TPA: peptidase S14 [Leucothrix mucor]|uniref:Peptidase S14 n=1 Tax=Leucothrix mucor TaxID=45248 RepID=A0A7V2SXY3_LEUMU|nr:peptidase S14 [Leucothrix mucor]
MSYQRVLATLVIFGSMAVYAESPEEKPVLEKAKTAAEKVIGKLAEKVVTNKENADKDEKSVAEDNKKKSANGSGEKSSKKSLLKEELDPETKALQKKKHKLSIENTLKTERLKNDNADLLARLQKLKWEKQEITGQLDIEDLKRERDQRAETIAYEEKLQKLTRESSLAKARAAKLSSELNAKRTEWDLKTARLTAEIKMLQVEKKREAYADRKPIYLDNPLKDDNTLVISDRRIALNGPILPETADYITTRINYYNNKDGSKPIFIVIDSSPGGSVMSGYRILKAMDGSKAPVYVVLKSYAASMAATMVTLAKKSFAYPNAVMLHHQISSTFFFTSMNLTQQKEHYAEMVKWWERLATPIAEKMGISTEEFIKKMYKKSSDGDWSEFASDAKALKWVDHIVERIEETSLLKDPDSEKTIKKLPKVIVAEGSDEKGRPVTYLPRLSPKDMYFIYNPDRYYQLR